MNASKLKARLIVLSLLAAFVAVMSISMTASATGSSVEPALSASTDLSIPDSEAVEADSDTMACWPDGTACSIFNDQCCGVCQVLIGHAGRCAFDTPPVAP